MTYINKKDLFQSLWWLLNKYFYNIWHFSWMRWYYHQFLLEFEFSSLIQNNFHVWFKWHQGTQKLSTLFIEFQNFRDWIKFVALQVSVEFSFKIKKHCNPWCPSFHSRIHLIKGLTWKSIKVFCLFLNKNRFCIPLKGCKTLGELGAGCVGCMGEFTTFSLYESYAFAELD